jgi:hydroxymethylbilane synthase
LRRAGFFDASYMRPIPVEQMVPAAAQGCLALQCCRDRPEIAALLGTLNDPDTALAVSLEREVIRLLDGDCHSPIGVYAVVSEESITLRACVAKRDGTPPLLTGAIVVDPADPGRGPRALVESLEARGVRGLLGK